MTEHVHEWKPEYDVEVYGESFQCGCGDMMATDEIARRLNATERLSAEDALDASEDSYEANSLPAPKHVAALKAYASALEGEIAPR